MTGLSITFRVTLMGALTALAVADMVSNIMFGWTIGPIAAVFLGAAGLFAFGLPIYTIETGWTPLYRGVWVACVALVVFAAFKNLGEGQALKDGAMQSKVEAKGSAQQNEEDARAELTRATVELNGMLTAMLPSDAAALVAQREKALADQDAAAKARGVNCQQRQACKTADAALAEARKEQGRANQREAAEKRVAAARAAIQTAQHDRKTVGVVTAGNGWEWLAEATGASPARIDQYMNLGLKLLMVAFAQIALLMSHDLVPAIGRDWRKLQDRKAASLAVVIEPSYYQPEPEPEEVAEPVRKRAPRQVPAENVAEVEEWSAMCLRARSGSALPGAAIFELYRRSGGELSSAAFGAAFNKIEGHRKIMRNGRPVYSGLAFRELSLAEDRISA